MAFLAEAESEAVLRSCLADLAMPNALITRGGIAKAIQHLSAERSPHILLVDISAVDLPVSAMHNLAEVCEPGVVVIAIGSRNDVGLYRDLLQSGVTDYLVKPLTPQLLAKSLRAATGTADAPSISQKLGKLVAVVGARGGVGASTLAVNMAWNLANRQNRRVALLDLDLQGGDCGLMLNMKPTSGLREALENPLRVDSIFHERAMAAHGERLFVLSSEEPLRDDLRFTPEAVETLLAVLRAQFHYVVVDVPRTPAPPFRRALDLADTRVVVADQTLRSMRDAARLRASLAAADERTRMLLIVNRSGEGGRREVSLREMAEMLELRPRCVIPFQPKLFAGAASRGQIAGAHRGPFRDALAALALELSGQPPERRRWWRRRR
jgi:pilus assembly protein CpaE